MPFLHKHSLMYVDTYAHTRVYTRVYIHTYVHSCVCVYMHMSSSVNVCMHVFERMQTTQPPQRNTVHTYIQTGIQTRNTNALKYTQKHPHTHTFERATHTAMFYTQYMYTQVRSLLICGEMDFLPHSEYSNRESISSLISAFQQSLHETIRALSLIT